MNQAELYGELRERIGNPEPNEVSNRQLDSYLSFALEWAAGEFKHVIRDRNLPLQADQREIMLSDEVLWVDWITWNGTKLTPASVDAWDRDGLDWRTNPSGNPSEFSVQGRRIIWFPPPSSDAVTTAGVAKMRFMAASERPDGSGVPGLSRVDQLLIVYQAGVDWCISHPSDENAARQAGFEKQIVKLLPAAKKRHDNPIDDYYPEFHPHVSRRGPAR